MSCRPSIVTDIRTTLIQQGAVDQDMNILDQDVFNQVVSNIRPYDRDLAQKIQEKLTRLYPEIKLTITNKPVWEKGKDVLNQIIQNEMGEDYWKRLYTRTNLINRQEFESVNIPGVKNKFKPDTENVYHGTNTYEINDEGDLILIPSKNFDDKTTSISFTQIPVVAQDYMLRRKGNIIIRVSNEALGNRYSIESADEIAVKGSQILVVPKGQYEIITVPTLEEKMQQSYANEIELRAQELRDNANSELYLVDAIYGSFINAANYSEQQAYGDIDTAEQAPQWYVPDEYLDSRAARKVYEQLENKITKDWIISSFSSALIEQMRSTGEYITDIQKTLNNFSTYGAKGSPHQSTLFEELLYKVGLGYSQRNAYLSQEIRLEEAIQKQNEYNEILTSIDDLVQSQADESVAFYNSPEQAKLRDEQRERDRINREVTQSLLGGEGFYDLPFQKIGDKILGQANIKAGTVLIDAVNQRTDTLPHEYAHHYIAWFRDAPIVQEAIRKWESEEALVQAIGEQVVKQKGEAYNWWNTFVNWVLNTFNNLSALEKEQLMQILTDAFLTRQNLRSVQEAYIPESASLVTSLNSKAQINTAYADSLEAPSNIDVMESFIDELLITGEIEVQPSGLFFTDGYTFETREELKSYLQNKPNANLVNHHFYPSLELKGRTPREAVDQTIDEYLTRNGLTKEKDYYQAEGKLTANRVAKELNKYFKNSVVVAVDDKIKVQVPHQLYAAYEPKEPISTENIDNPYAEVYVVNNFPVLFGEANTLKAYDPTLAESTLRIMQAKKNVGLVVKSNTPSTFWKTLEQLNLASNVDGTYYYVEGLVDQNTFDKAYAQLKQNPDTPIGVTGLEEFSAVVGEYRPMNDMDLMYCNV